MSGNKSNRSRPTNYADAAARSNFSPSTLKLTSSEPQPKIVVVQPSLNSPYHKRPSKRMIEENRLGTKKPYDRIPDFQPQIPRDKLDEWALIQNTLRAKQLSTDSFQFILPQDLFPPTSTSTSNSTVDLFESQGLPHLKYIGGIDISVKGDRAVVCLAIQEHSLNGNRRVLYLKRDAELREPYKAGFQAFREVPAMLAVLEEVREKHCEVYPQLLMVQGCGTWHFRKFGLASHLGVLADIPTIGVAKNFLWIRHEIEEDYMRYHIAELNEPGDTKNVFGFHDRFLYGAVMLTKRFLDSPYLYISSGHRVSLTTSVALVKYFGGADGMPTPILFADAHSREAVGASSRKYR